MKKRIAMIAMMASLVTTTAFAEGVKIDGSIKSAETKTILAPYSGVVGNYAVTAGDAVNMGDALFALRTEQVYADFDGTVTASGAELMSVGVSLTLTEKEMDQKVDSDIIYFKKIGGGVLYGDTDGSGDISVTDALLALQGSVGKIGLTDDQAAAADVDGDGKITVTDALLILQKSVGKIDKFPVEN